VKVDGPALRSWRLSTALNGHMGGSSASGGAAVGANGGAATMRGHLLSGALAGSLEILLFHPVDTAAKRLIVDTTVQLHNPVARNPGSGAFLKGVASSKPAGGSLVSPQGLLQRSQVSWRIVTGGLRVDAPLAVKLRSLYRGVAFAMAYKTLQRSFQYSVQPAVAKYLAAQHRGVFAGCFGTRLARPMEHAVAGSVMGSLEIIFLPIDSLKVKKQTNARLGFQDNSHDGKLGIMRGLWRGGTWTAARNSIGSFTLFGGAAFTKEHLLKLQDFERATLVEHFCASIAACLLCVGVSGPFDVIKTRVQRQGGEKSAGAIGTAPARVRGGFEILNVMVRQEGFRAFFKGTVPKCLVIGTSSSCGESPP